MALTRKYSIDGFTSQSNRTPKSKRWNQTTLWLDEKKTPCIANRTAIGGKNATVFLLNGGKLVGVFINRNGTIRKPRGYSGEWNPPSVRCVVDNVWIEASATIPQIAKVHRLI